MTYEILWDDDHYELWIDGHYIDDFHDYHDAQQVAMESGATKRVSRPYNDEGAPF